MKKLSVRKWISMAMLALLASSQLRAAEVNGSVRATGTRTDTEAGETEFASTDSAIRFSQRVTPWIRANLAYRHDADRFTDLQGETFERRSRSPSFEITYDRGILNGRLQYIDRRVRGTGAASALDADSTQASLFVKPGRGPDYSFQWRHERNLSDVEVFGRSVESDLLSLGVNYYRSRWSLRGSAEYFELQNDFGDLSVTRFRQFLAGAYQDSFFEDQVLLNAEYRVDRIEVDEKGSSLAESISAAAGLYALDLTPDIGPLASEPSLVDRDLTTPAGFPIDIGGANTFQNIGLDLGFRQPISRIQVTVDRTSDPGVQWRVYSSPDNLNWQLILGVAPSFDGAFLHYSIRFPRTEARFFKVVNVSANGQPVVLVTEIRGLVDIIAQERKRIFTDQHMMVGVTARPSEQVTANFDLSYLEDRGGGETGFFENRQEINYQAVIRVDHTPTLGSRYQYSYTDFERAGQDLLARQNERYAASLLWTPLPTVDTILTAARTEERGEGGLIRRSDSIQARGVTGLLPDLSLTSEILYSDVQDPTTGFESSGLTLTETMDSRPFEDWTLGASLSQSWYDARGRSTVSRRRNMSVFTSWLVTPYLTASGDWSYGVEEDRWTTHQGYVLSWYPGKRLAVTGSLRLGDSSEGVENASWTANLTYKLNRYLDMFSNLTHSTARQPFAPTARQTNLSAGLVLRF